jgi:hypothetical protein
MTPYALKDIWNLRHQYCEDEVPIDDLDEARFVLTVHAGHGSHCRQYLTALKRASTVTA